MSLTEARTRYLGGVSRDYLHRSVLPYIRSVKLGHRRLVVLADLEAFVRAHMERPAGQPEPVPTPERRGRGRPAG